MRWARGLVLLACVASPAWAAPVTDCTYRPWQGSVTPFTNSNPPRTFTTVDGLGTNYDKSLRNNGDYYRGNVTPDPPSTTAPYYTLYRFLRETHEFTNDHDRHLLVQYLQKVHSTQADEAVILIHGSGVYPDGWFSDAPISSSWGMPYLNFAGSDIYGAGLDVYAPYVTHQNDFHNGTKALGGAYEDENGSAVTWPDIDIRRVLALFNHLKAQGYNKIHIAGVSYGALVAVYATQRIESDSKRGLTLAVEGWLHTRGYAENATDFEEFSSNWAMIWPGPRRAEVINPPSNTWLAYGSCNAATYSDTYDDAPSNNVITYDGAHEFLYSVWQEALSRYQNP